MENIYSELDLTWSSVEHNYDYVKVVWTIRKNGIPTYSLIDENDNKIRINI